MIRELAESLESRVNENLPLIQVILGPRQIGKTYAAHQVYNKWEGSKLYDTADLISPPNTDWIVKNWERARSLPEPCLFILDEIQKIPDWSEAVKLLFDQDRNRGDLRIVLLGSASLSLQRGLSESLAGRYELLKAYHWNFNESNEIANLDLDQFLLFGGYPESYRYLDDIQRWQDFMRYSVIEPVLTRDIMGSRKINKPALFRQTFELAMQYAGREISLQKILGQLQDKGNVTTIQNYLHLFEGAFLLKQLQKYTHTPLRTKLSSPKLIPMSTCLTNAFLGRKEFSDSNERGHIFEAAVGAELAKLPGELFYWRDGKYEVDFVWKNNEQLYAIEVKSGRKKHLSGIVRFVEKFENASTVLIDSDNILEFFSKKQSFFS